MHLPFLHGDNTRGGYDGVGIRASVQPESAHTLESPYPFSLGSWGYREHLGLF